MPKSKKVSRKTGTRGSYPTTLRARLRLASGQASQRARALAGQRHAKSRGQKPDPSIAQSLRGLIIQSGWDGAARRSSSGSPSPLRSPAAFLCAHGKRAS